MIFRKFPEVSFFGLRLKKRFPAQRSMLIMKMAVVLKIKEQAFFELPINRLAINKM